MTDEELSALPPSAKLVFKVLEYEGAMTQAEIIEESKLSPRTVRSALDKLAELGTVEEDVFIPDARQSLYQLSMRAKYLDESAATEPQD